MKKYVIKLNGKVYEVEIEEVTGEAATSIVENDAPARASDSVQSTGGQKIDAPMPGNIVSVAVKPGDQVKKGQLLVVLEAMKMENEIVSPVDGKVVSVAVAKGDTVNVGEALVEIA